jgi:hypothetical protein
MAIGVVGFVHGCFPANDGRFLLAELRNNLCDAEQVDRHAISLSQLLAQFVTNSDAHR